MSTITSINSTTVRLAILPLVRAYFSVASRLLPAIARRQAESWFTRPPRYAGRRTHPVAARRETVAAGDDRLVVWSAGPATAPAALLSHGWGGSSVQMASFVAPLLAAGFRVVWFDQPGHGESGDGPVGLPDFVRAAQALAETHGPFAVAIGHSLGAAALAFALRRGLALERVVFVGSPASLREYTRSFARWLGITPRIREAMRRRLENRYGVRFAEIDRITELRKLNVPALFVHDRDDREVPFEHARRLSSCVPGARLIRTHGLGHYRILRNEAVVRAVTDFAAGCDSQLPDQLPLLPEPAPLY